MNRRELMLLLGRNRVAQPEFRQYRTHRRVPIEPSLVCQQCERCRGKGFSD